MLIRGGRVVDPSQGLDGLRDVRIRDGLIAEIGEHLQAEAGEDSFDASGAVVAPGFIDMHVHLREPGFSEKETIATGTQAALQGGFTAVAAMPNTQPALDSPEVLAQLAALVARDARCRVYPIGAITRARAGALPVDFAALAAAGAVAFSDDGNTIANARVLRNAALAARGVSGVFISHAEDEDLKGDAAMSAGSGRRCVGSYWRAEPERRRHRCARPADRHGHRQGVAHRPHLDGAFPRSRALGARARRERHM